jgi:L-iditol 2-dehydrogenase
MHMPAHTCFPVPDSVDDAGAALLEPLGVALHAVDLAHIGLAESLAILGAGPIGLCILQLVKLSGASPIFISDKFTWRLEIAKRYGAIPINCDTVEGVEVVMEATNGRGVDVAIEAAWADNSVQQAMAMARPGGRLVLVGIPFDDNLTIQHSTARRKGLTIRFSRRMKHTYPRTIRLVEEGMVDLNGIVSHRFPLVQTPEAYAMNAAYQDDVVKVVIDV